MSALGYDRLAKKQIQITNSVKSTFVQLLKERVFYLSGFVLTRWLVGVIPFLPYGVRQIL